MMSRPTDTACQGHVGGTSLRAAESARAVVVVCGELGGDSSDRAGARPLLHAARMMAAHATVRVVCGRRHPDRNAPPVFVRYCQLQAYKPFAYWKSNFPSLATFVHAWDGLTGLQAAVFAVMRPRARGPAERDRRGKLCRAAFCPWDFRVRQRSHRQLCLLVPAHNKTVF